MWSKSRRKDGDHYWVEAYVTPILRDGKPIGYLSVRTKPTRAQIAATATLYSTINNTPDPSTLPVVLSGGVLYAKGFAGLPARIARATVSQRLGAGLAGVCALATVPLYLGLQGFALCITQLDLEQWHLRDPYRFSICRNGRNSISLPGSH